jgi:hypothetical protein
MTERAGLSKISCEESWRTLVIAVPNHRMLLQVFYQLIAKLKEGISQNEMSFSVCGLVFGGTSHTDFMVEVPGLLTVIRYNV